MSWGAIRPMGNSGMWTWREGPSYSQETETVLKGRAPPTSIMQDSETDVDPLSEGESSEVMDVSSPSAASPGVTAEAPGAVSDELRDTPPDAVKPGEPVVTCDFCGPVKGPKAEVYQCQLCMKFFCIKHVDPFFHMCPSSRQS